MLSFIFLASFASQGVSIGSCCLVRWSTTTPKYVFQNNMSFEELKNLTNSDLKKLDTFLVAPSNINGELKTSLFYSPDTLRLSFTLF
jgi:hypothetical protein